MDNSQFISRIGVYENHSYFFLNLAIGPSGGFFWTLRGERALLRRPTEQINVDQLQ